MNTDEFVSISRDSILDILRGRYDSRSDRYRYERRRQARWPFPGTVELWLGDASGSEDYMLGQALNLSLSGIGILLDEELPSGRRVSIAIHQPEATLIGTAVVRHCAATDQGNHVGLEFLY